MPWWKNMVMADANTMIRCIIGDDEKKIAELQEIRKTQKILYSIEVIVEVVYVLTKVYQISRKECTDAIQKFLGAYNIVPKEADVVIRSLQLFGDNSLDFVDNILLAYHQLKGLAIYTYDKKLMSAINRSDIAGVE